MTYVNQTKFAKLAGVSGAAVSKAIKRGSVVLDREGIDTDNPINAKYLAGTGSTQQAAARRPATTSKPAKEQGNRRGKPGAGRRYRSNEAAVGEAELKKSIEVEIKTVELQSKKLKYFESVGHIVPSEAAISAFSRLSSVLQENFQTLDERISDHLYSLVQDGGTVEEVAEVLRNEIDRSMKSTVATVAREVKDMRMAQTEAEGEAA